jgi:hypothetical protein
VRALLVTASFVLLAAPALAQRSTATMRGTVTDPSEAVVPGASVTVSNQQTGLTRTTTTNGAGLYSVPELPVGSYRVAVEMPGFKRSTRTDIILNVADDLAIDFELEPGDATATVTVEGATAPVKIIGGDVSGLITGEQVRELPLNGRNFLQLAMLMPGVTAPDWFNAKDKGILQGGPPAVSGGGTHANLITLDGAKNIDVGSNGHLLVSPSVDMIEEFKVLRNAYGPEFGQAGGAHINIVSRGGSNTWHGSAFYSGRDDALDGTNYFLRKAGQPKERLKRHDFGGTVGGPIVRDSVHFFYAQEWNHEDRGIVRSAFVPTQAERTGDFSSPGIPGCSPPAPTDPLTGAPFPGNRIPSERISPAGLLYLQLYAPPNVTPTEGSCNNWVTSLDSPIRWRQENLRLDASFSESVRLMMRYTHDSSRNDAPATAGWGDDPFPAVDTNWEEPSRSVVTQLNKTLGARSVNSLQFSLSGNRIRATRGGVTPSLNDQINRAMPSIFANAGRYYGDARPHPTFWGSQGYGALLHEAPYSNDQDLFILKEDYSAVFGKHLVKAGALVSFNRKNEDLCPCGGSFESPEFWGSTGLNGFGGTTGNIVADLLLKDMTFGFRENSASRQLPERWADLEFYIGDSWKLSRVTLDYGVRYSMFFNPYAADDRITSFDPAAFDPELGADPCNGLLVPPGSTWCQEAGSSLGTPARNRSLRQQDRNNLAPRFGVAWDVTGRGKTAVRAGLGQFFAHDNLQAVLQSGNNPPFVENINGIRKLDTAEEPCSGCFSTTGPAPGAGYTAIAATPSNWQWNVAVEHEIVPRTTLEVSYVGSKGTDLRGVHDANQVRSGDINSNGIDDRLEYGRAPTAVVRPYGIFGDRSITMWDNHGYSTYHALQTQIRSRFGQSQLQGSYTWSRTISNDPLDNSIGGSVTDLDRPSLDRGLAATHRTHLFNTSLVLFLPSPQTGSRFVRHLLGNWEIATIASAASGSPLTIVTQVVPGLNGGVSGSGIFNQRPNRVAGESCRPRSGPPEQSINPHAFTLADFQIGSPGNSGAGVCEGPGMFQTDLALYKNIRTSNKVRLQLRFEIFNVFNRTNFLFVNTIMNPTAVTFDTPDAADATTITSFVLPANFGQAVAARDPRQAQIGIKLIF